MSQEEFEMDIVQKRLNGVAASVTIEIPWEQYDRNIQYIVDQLDREGVVITPSQVMQNMKIYEKFLDEIDDWVKEYVEYNFDEIDLDAYSIASRFYRNEIDEAKRIKAEAEKKRLAEVAQHEAELEVNGVMIKVEKKHAKKAEAILRAAGYIKD